MALTNAEKSRRYRDKRDGKDVPDVGYHRPLTDAQKARRAFLKRRWMSPESLVRFHPDTSDTRIMDFFIATHSTAFLRDMACDLGIIN